MPVTLRDIARHLGLSHATISFVLNDRYDIAIPESTRQRVKAVAQEMGYRPNRSARALVRGRSDTLAIYMPNVRNVFYSALFDQVHRLAEESGHDVLFWRMRREDAPPRTADFPVDGVIAVDLGHMVDQLPTRVPIVSIGANTSPDHDHVRVDLTQGAMEAVRHLASQGRKRIAHMVFDNIPCPESISHPGQYAVYYQRRDGYEAVMKEFGLPTEYILVHGLDRTELRRQLSEYFAKNGVPDGLFGYNDFITQAAIRAVMDAGKTVPGDCAIVGHDDIDEAALFSPSLSSVHNPIDEALAVGYKMLLERIENADLPIREEVFRTRLVIRESSDAAAK